MWPEKKGSCEEYPYQEVEDDVENPKELREDVTKGKRIYVRESLEDDSILVKSVCHWLLSSA